MNEVHRRKIGEPLSDASLMAMRSLLTRIAVQVSIMWHCRLAAANSQAIESVSVAELSEMNLELDVGAYVILN